MPEGDGGEAGDGSEMATKSCASCIHLAFCHPDEPRDLRSRRANRSSNPAAKTLAARHHLRLQPGGLRRRLRLLHDRAAGPEAQSHRRRNRRPDSRRAQRPASRDRARPRQPGLHGTGRALPELRQLHASRAAAGGRRRHSRVAHDGFDFGHRAAHRRLRRRAGASEAGGLAQRSQRSAAHRRSCRSRRSGPSRS